MKTRHLAGAGLDVAWTEPIDPDDPILAENVTVTPHIGGVTNESYDAMAEAFTANVRNLTTGKPLQHCTVR
ncbi:phosphoglycerate dehydrogenase-like enzyme [Rhodococcus sp. 27YEA15]|uniref:NAD(P)-dependent oxidoreductase n=1 Tax=Rhodococcus sp. 27YEA15 TaxID=3156259 RepID=UPI003C7AA497